MLHSIVTNYVYNYRYFNLLRTYTYPTKLYYVVMYIQCYSVGSKEDFLQEIAVTKTFVHPNIVRVYGSVDKGNY